MDHRPKFQDLIGVLKDKASMSKAILLSGLSSKSFLSTILRITTHKPIRPPSAKLVSDLLSAGNSSRVIAALCVETLMDRLHKTGDSVVALKALLSVHHILRQGSFILQDQLSIYPSSGGRNYLNLSSFRDNSSPLSWKLSHWVRYYARILEQILSASRILGFFLNFSDDHGNDTVTSLLTIDLCIELDALVKIIEDICKEPERETIRENKLIEEIRRLIIDDCDTTLRNIYVRVLEIKERTGCLGYADSIDISCVLKRLQSCENELILIEGRRKEREILWDLLKELKDRVAVDTSSGDQWMMNLGKRDKLSESARIFDRVIRREDSFRYMSARMIELPALDEFLYM